MRGFTLWFTGVPGSGKSTLAKAIEGELLERGVQVELLDGGEALQRLSQGSGFSKQDWDAYVARLGFVCHLLTRNDVVAIAAAISPTKAAREENRALIGRYVEVYCRCAPDVLDSRDPEGLRSAAKRGETAHFVGISDPYEEPEKPEIVCDTGKDTPAQSSTKILKTLEILGYLPPSSGGDDYSEDEEEEIRKRLSDLGYI